jgi:hypothetical protein
MVASVAASPSLTVVARTGRGGVIGALVLATTDGSSSARGGADLVLEGWGRGLEETTRALNARRFRGPRLSTPVSACLREDEYQHKQTSRKSHDRQKLKSETYILERTRAFFTRRSDVPYTGAARFEPCSGTVRLGPAVSSAAPLRLAASTAATLSPMCSGAVPRPPQWQGLDYGPRWRQGTHEHPGLRRPR